MTRSSPAPLSVDQLRLTIDPTSLGVTTSDELHPADAIVGQGPALEALATGLDMSSRGYNVFLTGSRGTGRFAAVRQVIGACDVTCNDSSSLSYVYDFARGDRPILITLPSDQGRPFQMAVDELRKSLGDQVPALLGSEVMAKSRQRLIDKFERESAQLFSSFEQRVDEAGFVLAHSQSATGTVRMPDIFPLVDGDPIAMEQLEADPTEAGLDTDGLASLRERHGLFKDELGVLVLKHRRLSTRYQQLVSESERRKLGEAIQPLFSESLEPFMEQDENIAAWVKGLEDELLENLDLFRPRSQDDTTMPNGPTMEGFLWYVRTNLLVEPGHEEQRTSRPVVEEIWPTWRNLFGTIEGSGEAAAPTFTDIKSGSLLRANGGYLVLYAGEVVRERGVYEHLKRVLRKGELEIAAQQEGAPVPFTLKPTPIPLDVKVILVGERHAYDVLRGSDPDFASLFKVKVEFEDDIARDEGAVAAYLAVVKRIINKEKLRPFNADGLSALVEEGARVAGDREHLTTRFAVIADLMRESDHVASDAEGEVITGDHVRSALARRRARHDLVERKMLENFHEGKMLLEVTGHQTGQVNGLGYYQLDDAEFGLPARISATCAMGRQGVVNIEREADLSGRVHDKGILILTGFLASRFAQDKPLSLHANIAFEQSYAMVDGDSASLGELLAILSALSGVPLRQSVAVTGSLNQHGQVQPVGGVTEKVTGFFRICDARGLTGDQGAMIPSQNISDLHFGDDVCEAVAAGKFHLWPVSRVEESIEVMTSTAPAEVFGACDATLRRYAEVVRRYSR